MLMHLTTNRLSSGCGKASVLAPMRRLQPARLLTSCAWSKRDEVFSNWDSLRNNPKDWYDNRNRKTNPRAPDFVRKDDRNVAIWVDGRDNPEWSMDVLAELDTRQAARPPRNNDGYDRQATTVANWHALRDHPEEWFDNRSRKTNPKAPDFRRKDDRSVALWLDGNDTPDWVGELLAELDARRAERSAAGYQQQQQYPDEGQERERDPEALEAKRAAELLNWEDLRSNPDAWFDNRYTKNSPRQPDFRRKDNRSVVLWLSSYGAPEWVDSLTADLDARQAERRPAGYQQQQQYPDEGQPPPQQYAPRERDAAYFEAKLAAEQANWEDLRNNPDAWFDNRHTKRSEKYPDFKRKDDRSVALWLTSRGIPEWIDELLEDLDARQAERAALRNAPAQ